MKFKKQKDGYSCGPIAIYNAMVDEGHKDIPYKLIKKACLTKYKKKYVGTCNAAFQQVAKILDFKLREVKKIRKTGKYFVLYEQKSGGLHYVYIRDGIVFNGGKNWKTKMRFNDKYIDYVTKKYYRVWKIGVAS